jgi:hypothetical protein
MAIACAVLFGWGGDDGVEPTLIPGGGVSDPGIAGSLFVHVIDEDDDAAVAGAMVLVGDQSASTDASGPAPARPRRRPACDRRPVRETAAAGR